MADLTGVAPPGDVLPPTAQNVLNFMQFLVKFGKMLALNPWRVGTPSKGNPGSAPDWSIHNCDL